MKTWIENTELSEKINKNPGVMTELPEKVEKLDASLRMLTDFIPKADGVLTRIDFKYNDKQISFCFNSSTSR